MMKPRSPPPSKKNLSTVSTRQLTVLLQLPDVPANKKSMIANELNKRRNVPMNVFPIIARYIKNSKTRKALAGELPPGLVSPPRPPPRGGRTRDPAVYRTLRKYKYVEYEPKNALNKVLPIAYKNMNWKYFAIPANGPPLFFNTYNSKPFVINSRTGARRNVPARFAAAQPNQAWTQELRRTGGVRRRKDVHTWPAYLKRTSKFVKYAKGDPVRQKLLNNIYENVNNPKWTLSQLMFYLRNSSSTAAAQYKKRAGRWVNVLNRNRPVNRNEVRNLIKNLNR